VHLDFELCDLDQAVLTRLDQRRAGGWVELGLCAGRRGFCPLSLDDEARELATAIDTVLRITLKGPEEFSRPLFIGRVIIPERQRGTEGQSLGLTASDPYFHMERKLAREVSGATWKALAFAAKDQSQIMWSLIASVVADHGVVQGSLPASVNRDRTYAPGKEIGQALLEMSEVIGGPDFEFAPVLASDGTLAEFNTFYPRQGSDLSDSVVFECGGGEESATGLIYSPGGEEICNAFLAIGAPQDQEGESPFATHPAYFAKHAESIDELDQFEKREQLDDVTELATLKAYAEGSVATTAYPIPYFDFIAAPEQYEDEAGEGVPPIFGVGYWLGDTIKVLDHDALDDDGEPLELTGRVTDAKVTERESGQIEVKVTCAPEVSSAGVSGEALTLQVPEGE
jgi:hypothetical protein